MQRSDTGARLMATGGFEDHHVIPQTMLGESALLRNLDKANGNAGYKLFSEFRGHGVIEVVTLLRGTESPGRCSKAEG